MEGIVFYSNQEGGYKGEANAQEFERHRYHDPRTPRHVISFELRAATQEPTRFNSTGHNLKTAIEDLSPMSSGVSQDVCPCDSGDTGVRNVYTY